MKRLAVVLLILAVNSVILLLVASVIRRYYETKFGASQSQDLTTNSQGQVLQVSPPETPAVKPADQSDLVLYKQKYDSDTQAVVSPVSVTFRTVSKTDLTTKIEVMVSGNVRTNLYSSDIILKIQGGIPESVQVQSGSVFPLYPRSFFDGTAIQVSGASKISDSEIIFGQPERVFATIVINKRADQSGEMKLSLDTENSSVFYQTQNILDIKKSQTEVKI